MVLLTGPELCAELVFIPTIEVLRLSPFELHSMDCSALELPHPVPTPTIDPAAAEFLLGFRMVFEATGRANVHKEF